MARSLAASRGGEAERQTLPIEVAGIASGAGLHPRFPEAPNTRSPAAIKADQRQKISELRGRYRSIRSIISEYFPHRGPRDRPYRVIAQNCIHFEHLVV